MRSRWKRECALRAQEKRAVSKRPSSLLVGGKTASCVHKAVPGARVQWCTIGVVARGGQAESRRCEGVAKTCSVRRMSLSTKTKRVGLIRLYPYGRPRWGARCLLRINKI